MISCSKMVLPNFSFVVVVSYECGIVTLTKIVLNVSEADAFKLFSEPVDTKGKIWLLTDEVDFLEEVSKEVFPVEANNGPDFEKVGEAGGVLFVVLEVITFGVQIELEQTSVLKIIVL